MRKEENALKEFKEQYKEGSLIYVKNLSDDYSPVVEKLGIITSFDAVGAYWSGGLKILPLEDSYMSFDNYVVPKKTLETLLQHYKGDVNTILDEIKGMEE